MNQTGLHSHFATYYPSHQENSPTTASRETYKQHRVWQEARKQDGE